MQDLTFVDIAKVNPNIITDIRYATTNNFTGRVLYSSAVCLLRRPVAKKLDLIQKNLEKKKLGLKIYDGYRPRYVQRIFWEIIPDTRYVADPNIGSKHNRGAAVDVTLVDENGNELEMPTPFDDFTEIAHTTYTHLPKHILANRTLLHDAMKEQGFIPLPTEWWHFDDAEWEKYPLEDIPIEEMITA